MTVAEHRIPGTPFALLSGSAGWGVPLPEGVDEPGVKVLERGLTFDTPWGPCGNWQAIEFDRSITSDGRSRVVLNVFSHGWLLDAIDHGVHRKVGWILQQAGARKVVADSTSGSTSRFLVEGDFIIPADVIDLTQTMYPLSPGRFSHSCSGAQLFCPCLGAVVEEAARGLWPAPGRVYGHDFQVVVAHSWGPRFKSPAEGRAFEVLGAHAKNQSIGPEATAMREIGACFASAGYIVRNHIDVRRARTDANLDRLHHEYALAASRISLRTMARITLSDECGCAALRTPRPEGYAINAQGGAA